MIYIIVWDRKGMYNVTEEIFMRRSIQIDRSVIFVAESNEALEEQDIEYWNNASVKEKLQTITYLRECFYGTKATTGRLQRFHKVLKLK